MRTRIAILLLLAAPALAVDVLIGRIGELTNWTAAVDGNRAAQFGVAAGGPTAQAFKLSGNGNMTCGALAVYTNMTVSFWITQSDTTPDANAFWLSFHGGDCSTYGWLAAQITDGTLYSQVRKGGSCFHCTSTPADTNWHHYAFTVGSRGNVTYLDGVGISTNTGGTALSTGALDFARFGENVDGGGGYLTGAMDDIRIFTNELSEADIKALHDDEEASTVTNNLFGWWRCPMTNPTNGQIIADLSIQGRGLTVTNVTSIASPLN